MSDIMKVINEREREKKNKDRKTKEVAQVVVKV